MENLKNTEDLKKRITELEYRLRLIEKFLDLPSSLCHKDDESIMNSIRMEVIQGMNKEGYDIEVFEKIWGTKFYRKT